MVTYNALYICIDLSLLNCIAIRTQNSIFSTLGKAHEHFEMKGIIVPQISISPVPY